MKTVTEKNKLKREIYKVPEFIEKQLKEKGLLNAYEKRPHYQRNDYVGWITRAKLEETKQKRLNQMLAELKKGNKYMNMDYNGA